MTTNRPMLPVSIHDNWMDATDAKWEGLCHDLKDSIESLFFDYTTPPEIFRQKICQAIADSISLKDLVLKDPFLSKTLAEDIEYLWNHKTLQRLTIRNYPISKNTINTNAIQALAILLNKDEGVLISLGLEYMSFDWQDLSPLFDAIANHKTLRELRLYQLTFTEEQLVGLEAAVKKNESLRRVTYRSTSPGSPAEKNIRTRLEAAMVDKKDIPYVPADQIPPKPMPELLSLGNPDKKVPPLSEEQRLLMIYIESFLVMANKTIIDDHYKQVNNFFTEANLPLQIKKTERKSVSQKDDIKQQLNDLIYQRIPANELHGLIGSTYNVLNEKHKFDSSGEQGNLNRTLNRIDACSSLRELTEHFYKKELQQSERKAKKETILFCLFVVTIPFFKLFYNYRQKHYSQDQFFQKMFVNHEALKEITTKKTETGSLKKVYGLLHKNATHAPAPFKEVLFSKKGNIRKFTFDLDDKNWSKSGLTFLGTKEQIQDAKKKFEACLPRKNFR